MYPVSHTLIVVLVDDDDIDKTSLMVFATSQKYDDNCRGTLEMLPVAERRFDRTNSSISVKAARHRIIKASYARMMATASIVISVAPVCAMMGV